MLHRTAIAAHERVGNYWSMLPEASQARKALWEAINPHTGKFRIDEAFPEAIRRRTRDHDMLIEFLCGSTWQVVGSDNFNSLVGSAPIGITFSEFALSNPLSWTYLRPILRENGGWAAFIYTVRGRNHGYEMAQLAKRLMAEGKDWFYSLQGVEQTGLQHLRDAEIEEGMSEELAEQEYDCSFDSSQPGAYYGPYIKAARRQGRIGRVPIASGVPCQTWWDLGMDDSMSIWITQTIVREIRVVHYHEDTGKGLGHYATYLNKWAKQHEVDFLDHNMPHDIEVRELGTGKSRREVWETDLNMGTVNVAPALDVLDGIEQVRRLFPQFWFDEEQCKHGLMCLTDYSKEWDEKNKCYKLTPKHNWASHGADAMRTLGLLHTGRAEPRKIKGPRDKYAEKKRRKHSWMGA